MKGEVLQIKDLSVGVKDKRLFNDVTISFFEGEVVLLEGTNGVGKTTFLKTILGLDKNNRKQEKGEIIWNGYKNVLEMNDNDLLKLRSRIAYLEQKDNYDGLYGITVKDILYDSLEAYKGKISSEDEVFLEQIFSKYCPVGAAFSLKSKICKMSGGQQRMVSIIAALCVRDNADVFIIDEPLNNLDLSSIVHISNLLNRIRIENPKALFLIISHCKIFPFINRVIRFDNGNLYDDKEGPICHACFGEPDADGFYKT